LPVTATALPDVEFARHFPLPGLGASGLVNFEYETHEPLLLGSGNRVLVKGGKLDAKYLITVPQDMRTPPPHTTDKSGS
jgi:hypothetical protein